MQEDYPQNLQCLTQSRASFCLFMGEVMFKSAENKITWVSEDIKASQDYAGAAADFSDSM